MATLERRRRCRDTTAAPPLRTRDRPLSGYHARAYTMELTNISHGNSICMSEYLIAARCDHPLDQSLGRWEFIYRRGELDAGIAHPDVEATEFIDRRGDQSAHGFSFDISAPS
jgi:hypothetical protein